MWPTTALVLFLALQSNYYELGVKALDEKRYQEAVDNFINAIAAEPKDYSLHFNLALAYSLMSKDAEAIPEYKKVLEMKPGLYQAELNLGILLLRDKQGAEAVPILTDAVSQKPKEFRPNVYLAAALFAGGEFAKAEQTYKAALEIDPKSPDAELGLAHALVKQDRVADAAPHFQTAATLNQNYRDGLLELASLYEASKQSPEAIAIYQQFPDNPGAEERLGALLLASGQPADALAHFQAAVAKSPTAANRAALATAYLRNKEPDKALPVVDQILATTPNDFELRMLHGRILRDQRKFAPAAEDFLTATKIKPDSAEAWSELAAVLVVAEDHPAALAALDKLAALHAEKAGHVFLRAIVLDKIRQQKPALESYQRFLAMSNGQNPNEEFQARQRIKILEREIRR